MNLRWGAVVVLGLWSSAPGCSGCESPKVPPPSASSQFQDFTVASINSVALFDRLAMVPHYVEDGLAGVKFVVTQFPSASERSVRFLDGTHYNYHDEWFWFRLLNGAPVAGIDMQMQRGRWAHPGEFRTWALTHASALPSGIQLIEGRVAAPIFYELGMNQKPRQLGPGTLIHLPARGRRQEPLWGFMVDETDAVTTQELAVFFAALTAALPPEIAEHLLFVAQTAAQEDAARALATPRGRPTWINYAALGTLNRTEVYSEGIVAGHLFLADATQTAADAPPTAVVLSARVPSVLPDVRGILTGSPQVALSHLALLARNRGLPDCYRGGADRDPVLRQLAARGAPVLLQCELDEARVVPITEAELTRYEAQRAPQSALSAPGVVSSGPYVIDLRWVHGRSDPRLMGGKAAGMATLLSALAAPQAPVPAVTTPYRPLAIAARAFVEHIRPLKSELEALSRDPLFRSEHGARVWALEGANASAAAPGRLPPPACRNAPTSHAFCRWGQLGGLRRVLRTTPLTDALRAKVLASVRAHFALLDAGVGLRFRSSSTVEDVDGFNGAGLYSSETGYPDRDTHEKKSLEWALLKTWASFFSVPAVEERMHFGLEPFAGAMAVLVHPRFDDSLELANGVFTFDSTQPGEFTMNVNAQVGAISVVLPKPGDPRPEVSRVKGQGAQIGIERRSLSTAVGVGTRVLLDADLSALANSALRVAQHWPRTESPPPMLDFEFRIMGAGWPAETAMPRYVVLKQVRTLRGGNERAGARYLRSLLRQEAPAPIQ